MPSQGCGQDFGLERGQTGLRDGDGQNEALAYFYCKTAIFRGIFEWRRELPGYRPTSPLTKIPD